MEKILILFLLFDALIACVFYKSLKGRAYIIPALVALGTAGYQAYKAHQQKQKAKKLKESNYVPGAVEEAIASERLRSHAASPEYTRGLEKLRQSTANTIDASKRVGGSSGQLQQSIADADAREKENIKDLHVAEAATKGEARSRLGGLLMTKGGYQQQSRDAYNATKSALIASSEQNMYNAVTGVAEGVVHSLPDSAFGAGVSTGLSKKAMAVGGGGNNYLSLNRNNRFVNGGFSPRAMRGKNGLGKVSPYDFRRDYNLDLYNTNY